MVAFIIYYYLQKHIKKLENASNVLSTIIGA